MAIEDTRQRKRVPFIDASAASKVRFAAAAFCGGISMLVLLGWAWDITAFTQIFPSLMPVNPVTAVALALAGTALAFHQRVSRKTLWALCSFVVLIGLAKLLQIAGLSAIPIDQLLFTDKLGEVSGTPASRMAPNTALAIILAGFAIATSRSSSGGTILLSQALCCFLIAITLFAMVGYALGVVALYGKTAFNPMALHTALALTFIAAGTLSTNTDIGLMRVLGDPGPAGHLFRRVLPLVVLAPVLVGILRLEGQKLGFYNTSTGVALQVYANMILTFSLLMVSIVLLRRSDLTRRRRETAVRRSEEEFRLAESLGRVGHWRLDIATNELSCSPGLLQICGLSESERPTRSSILALFHPDDAQEQLRSSERATKEGEGWDEHRRIIRPNGVQRIIQSNAGSEKNDKGEVVSLFGVFADITDLELARQQAEQATAAKADFLANMSHEVRTPLNSIIGFTDLILEDPDLSEKHQKQLRLVKNSGDALLTVVNDILDFSKMEAGKFELSIRSFDLAHLAQSTTLIVRQAAETKGLSLEVEVSADLQRYYVGDDSRIRQILLNLLSNAVKFTPNGGVTLSIDCALRGEHDAVTFVVKDTGIGVSQKDENRLFAQFSQANSSISREHGGTGLGLAISRALVTLMKGEIGYRSLATGGSEFWFSIPLRPSDEPQLQSELVSVKEARAQRILVVEDIVANQELAIAVLGRRGHKVSIASNGREALSVVQKQEFDLILMDIQMPIMDGITATKLIRLLPGYARVIPIIALTANILPEQLAVFRSVGMNDHVGKPINFVELDEAIARNIHGDPSDSLKRALAEEPSAISFDEKVFKNLTELLSADRLSVHSATFQSAMTQLEAFGESPETLRRVAHTMISQAGMFGFLQLAAVCRDLENASDHHWPPDQLAIAVRSAITFARSRLDKLEGAHASRLSA